MLHGGHFTVAEFWRGTGQGHREVATVIAFLNRSPEFRSCSPFLREEIEKAKNKNCYKNNDKPLHLSRLP